MSGDARLLADPRRTPPANEPLDLPSRPTISTPGLVLAVMGYLVSLTPSLVPRTTAGQVAVSVVLTLTGYLVGMLSGRLAGWLHSLVRSAPPTEPSRWLRRGQVGIVVALLVGGLIFTPSGLGWQSDQAGSVGWAVPSWLTVMVLTPVLVVGVILVGRGVRTAARWLARPYGRFLPYRLARVAGVVTAAGLLASLVAGMGWYQTNQFEALNLRTDQQQQPTSALRSGGPGSLVEWADLGRQGRTFVMGGPSARAITGFTGEPALEPIRVYVGMGNAPTPRQRAELAVAELERTGAFDRAKLVIVVTSGMGAVHPVSAITLEFAAGGDVATVATQYSYLPSFMTAVVDTDGAEREARALIPAVLDAVRERPEGQRPEVYLHGESLGALGSQRYLLDQTPEEVTTDFAGVLWIGTPAASELVDRWAEYGAGSPAWEPTVGGGAIARFAAAPGRIPADDPTWGPHRILFLHSATDPVVHLALSVATSPPRWLEGERGERVPEGMVWWPVFTWEQVLLDLTTNGFVPPGVGHNYAHAHAAGWAAVMQVEGWTPEVIDALNSYRREVVAPVPKP